MQFKAIIVLALAAAVSAVPAGDLDARTGSSCGSGLALSCCQQLQKIPSFLGITIPIQLGVGCTLNVLSAVCNQQAACCQTSSSSNTGLVVISGNNICNNVAA